MKSRDYWEIFWSHRFSILAIALAAAAFCGLSAHSGEPQYRATSSLYFSLPTGSSATDLNQGSTYTQAQMLSFADLASTPIVLDPVIRDLNLSMSSKQLAHVVSATANKETVLLELSATSPRPAEAAAISNSVAQHLGDI